MRSCLTVGEDLTGLSRPRLPDTLVRSRALVIAKGNPSPVALISMAGTFRTSERRRGSPNELCRMMYVSGRGAVDSWQRRR